jgi:hypothetical protein
MLELVTHQPDRPTQERLIRVMLDVRALGRLTPAQTRAIYSELEDIRDLLSRLLDRADGKSHRQR